MSIREVYEKFDLLEKYIDLADQELRSKALMWGIDDGDSMADIIDRLPL